MSDLIVFEPSPTAEGPLVVHLGGPLPGGLAAHATGWATDPAAANPGTQEPAAGGAG